MANTFFLFIMLVMMKQPYIRYQLTVYDSGVEHYYVMDKWTCIYITCSLVRLS